MKDTKKLYGSRKIFFDSQENSEDDLLQKVMEKRLKEWLGDEISHLDF